MKMYQPTIIAMHVLLGAQLAACEGDYAGGEEETEVQESASETVVPDQGVTEDSGWGTSSGDEGGVTGSTSDANPETELVHADKLVDTPTDPLSLSFGDVQIKNAIDGNISTKAWKTQYGMKVYSPPPGWVITDQFDKSSKHGNVSYAVSTFGPGQFVTAQQIDNLFKLAIDVVAKKGDKGQAALKAEWQEMKESWYLVSSSVQTIQIDWSISCFGTWINKYTSTLLIDIDAEIMYVGDAVPKDKQQLKQQIQAKYGITIDEPPPPPPPPCGNKNYKEICPVDQEL